MAIDMLISTLRQQYIASELTPLQLLDVIEARLAAAGDDAVWISRIPSAGLRDTASALERRAAREGVASMPLYGIPFAVKDNIDAAGLPTTAACPAFAYTPERSAAAVERLLAAGALLIGKTNLDQFATGLVGTRSPYGVPRNPFNADYIPGGSSSGSAVAVATGLVSFALGTDTAGSGRVPAAFNNIVGLKPTRGLVSAAGVVPACQSLDCVSIFALTVEDSVSVLDVMHGFDAGDPLSRPPPAGFAAALAPPPPRFSFGVPGPEHLRFGNAAGAHLFAEAVARLERLGGSAVEIDYAPFAAASELLYGSPLLAERAAAIGPFFADHADALHPVTREIITGGTRFSAVDMFQALYRLEELRTAARAAWQVIDFLVLPTAGTIYRLTEIQRDPIVLNGNLGYYTSFVNLMDLAAIAVPNGFDAAGLPAGVTLIAPAWHDMMIASVAAAFQRATGLPLGATGIALPPPTPSGRSAFPYISLAVLGAHLSGEPLNAEIVALGARLRSTGRTRPNYRLYALPDGRRPGLVRDARGTGHAIEVEVWDIPTAALGALVATIAPPLGIGTVELDDGSAVTGFLCEPYAVGAARDISEFGGWRAYRRSAARA